MSGNGLSPVDAHLVVRYAPYDGYEGSDRSTRRRSSIQGTSICVAEPWSLEDEDNDFSGPSESPGSRRLSASLRVCDLYQCVHQHTADTLHPQQHSGSFVARPGLQAFHEASDSSNYQHQRYYPRRFSDAGLDLGFGARFTLGRSASYTADSANSHAPHYEEMVWRKPGSRQSSLSSSSQASSGIDPTSSASHRDHNCDHQEDNEDHENQSFDASDPNSHEHSGRPSHHDCWVDLSNPCCRHHHRRNSTAIKFRKALYEEE
ncbi:LAME_0H14532g1_1 [Lachancea meyersii CBS 8951]|uniref:LAME_0H14532g1_1 n=1 Tax=Lachancea meyersii CBS 8951 TaxID=1266667 RepID=A0A1G4KHL5_9SACH|nr:LAME_0H14532g1_1 [Lachancea meyersii CBS 8951]